MTVAVVGTGSIGRRHLRNLVALGHEPIAVSEHSNTRSLAIDGHDIACVPSMRDAFDRGASMVFIGNPTSMHERSTRDAIAAGVDVYLEKPAATTGAACAGLAALAGAAGLIVAVGQQLRFHPILDRVRDVLAAERLGTLLTVEANFGEHLADYHPDEDYRISYAARRELGGGVLLTQIHLVDLLVWLVGPFASVSALGGHRSDLEVDVEDTVSFLARTVGDVPVQGHLDYLQRPKRSQVSITGSDGRLDLDLQASTVTFVAGRNDAVPEVEHIAVERNDLFVAAAADFLEAVATRRPPACGLDEATEVLDVVDSIKESMASAGRTVDVPRRPAVEHASGGERR